MEDISNDRRRKHCVRISPVVAFLRTYCLRADGILLLQLREKLPVGARAAATSNQMRNELSTTCRDPLEHLLSHTSVSIKP